MRLDIPPGIELSSGRFTVLVGPPHAQLQVLTAAASTRFLTLYLYGTTSRILHRLPRRGCEVEVQSSCTAHQLLQVIRRSRPRLCWSNTMRRCSPHSTAINGR